MTEERPPAPPGEIESCRACIAIARTVPHVTYQELAAMHATGKLPPNANPDLLRLAALRQVRFNDLLQDGP